MPIVALVRAGGGGAYEGLGLLIWWGIAFVSIFILGGAGLALFTYKRYFRFPGFLWGALFPTAALVITIILTFTLFSHPVGYSFDHLDGANREYLIKLYFPLVGTFAGILTLVGIALFGKRHTKHLAESIRAKAVDQRKAAKVDAANSAMTNDTLKP